MPGEGGPAARLGLCAEVCRGPGVFDVHLGSFLLLIILMILLIMTLHPKP